MMFSDCRSVYVDFALILCHLLTLIPIVKGETTTATATTKASVASLVSNEQLEAFRSAHNLREGVRLHLQQVSAEQTVSVHGKAYNVDTNGIEPYHVYTRDATYTHNGVPSISLPPTNVFQWNSDTEIVTLIQKKSTESGNIESTDLLTVLVTDRETGEVVEISNVVPGVLATVAVQDYDLDALQKSFRYGSTTSNHGDYQYRRRRAQEHVGAQVLRRDDHHQHQDRSLASDAVCDQENSRVLELAVAYDSSFCQHHGGREHADAAVTAYVALVSSTKYQQDGVCYRVELSHLEGHCGFQKTDPYRDMVHLENVGCGGTVGVLQEFGTLWDAQRTDVRRDVAHLLSGTPLGCELADSCYAGCAYVGTSCTGIDAYAVNHVTFTESYDTIAVLMAHELGHNNGADHYTEKGYIMYPTVEAAPKGFSDASRYQFDAHFLFTRCNNDDGDKEDIEILFADASICNWYQVLKKYLPFL